MERIKSIDELRKVISEPTPEAPLKIQKKLNKRAQNFIRLSPLVMLSTSNERGESTVSPKGGDPGFVLIEDSQTVCLPERKGNRLIFSLQNILHNPNVGLLFIVPGTHETLRMSGTGELIGDQRLCQRFMWRGSPALLVIRVRVEECYFHCAKALLRSSLWQPDTWPPPVKVSFGEEIASNSNRSEEFVKKFDSQVHLRYKTDL